MIIVGIAGKAQVGKDTSADFLVKYHGFKKFAFADLLKQVAEVGGWNGIKDNKGRKYLQTLGDVMREYESNIFINEIKGKIKYYEEMEFCSYKGIVISDVRLLTEIEALKGMGAQIWLVKRNVESVQAHKTEMLDESSYPFDIVLDNNGTFSQLYNGINMVLEKLNEKTN